MYAEDFEYAGQLLSDYGFIICDFNSSSGSETVDAGSQITFNTVSMHSGKYWGLASTTYDTCLAATFDICKDPCSHDDMKISDIEYRSIARWLNRNEFLKFAFIDDENESEACYCDASFNISEIKISGQLYGLELTMVTNRPFGYGDISHEVWTITDTSQVIKFIDNSDELGYAYPDLIITCSTDGDLRLENVTEKSVMLIQNCSAGEVITVHGKEQIIESSLSEHEVYNDFNFEFFRIGNTFDNRMNEITVSLPCKIELLYIPIIKGII